MNQARNADASRGHSPAEVDWLLERLSDRDWQIVEVTNRLRLLSGQQLERLCFTSLSGHAREVVRGRVLRRLVQWKVLAVSTRRIGGAARGSGSALFALGSAGARLFAERQTARATRPRVRHPGIPTERTLRHSLAVSELYVHLVEHTQAYGASVLTFVTEPASWWPNGIGGFIKPDAYVALASGSIREHWWIEVDQATESLPTIKRKLETYLDFVQRGQLGPQDVVPRVLVSTVTLARGEAIRTIAHQLPHPAAALLRVAPADAATSQMLLSLRDESDTPALASLLPV